MVNSVDRIENIIAMQDLVRVRQNIKTDIRRMGRPTLDEAASLNDIILDAAHRLFCDKGYGASMDEIAAASDVTKLTIYRRFPSKEALLIAMIDRELERFAANMATAHPQNATPMEALEQTARSMFQFSIVPDNLKISRLLLIEAYTNDKVQERFNYWMELANKPAILVIAAAQRSGDIIDDDPDSLAEILRDLMEGMPRWARYHGAAPPDPKEAEVFFEERWAFFKRAITIQR